MQHLHPQRPQCREDSHSTHQSTQTCAHTLLSLRPTKGPRLRKIKPPTHRIPMQHHGHGHGHGHGLFILATCHKGKEQIMQHASRVRIRHSPLHAAVMHGAITLLASLSMIPQTHNAPPSIPGRGRGKPGICGRFRRFNIWRVCGSNASSPRKCCPYPNSVHGAVHPGSRMSIFMFL
jgi:hypothetical protein